MRSQEDPYGKWEKARRELYGHLMDPVLKRIREEGPLTAKDFVEEAPPAGASPRDKNPSRVALEMLFWQGEIMIRERENFERVYDLTERVLPEGVDTRIPDDGELGRFLVRRALRAHGIASEKEIADHIQAADRQLISASIYDLIDSEEVVTVMLDGDPASPALALPERLEEMGRLDELGKRVCLLSPFDNMIIQRERVQKLFDFDYVLECYRPAAKRVYGYYVLPVLWGDRLVARVDPKADRKKKVLILRQCHFEPEVHSSEAFLSSLAGEIWRLAAFNGCEEVKVEAATPETQGHALERFLKEGQ
jgi:uncharacterized protein YcaQ